MTTHQTIESFFLADYERLREENERLNEIISEMELSRVATESGTGFTDLGKKVEAVKYTLKSSYEMFGYSSSRIKDYTVEQLEKILNKNDVELFDWASKTDAGGYYGKVIRKETHTFPFSVLFGTYKGTYIYAYDPDKYKTSLVNVHDKACEDDWVKASLDEDCKALVIDLLREAITERIEELKKQEEE